MFIDKIKEYINENKKISIIIVCGIICFVFIGYMMVNSNNNDNYDYIDYNHIITDNNENSILDKVDNKKMIKIHITGEVNKEGVVLLEEGDRIEDAINKAGGLKKAADVNKINLAYELSDGQKVYIPSIYENNIDEYIDDSPGDGVLEELSITNNGKININKADISELTSISGIGEGTALKIINYRNQNGKFKSIEDLKNVSGIGEKKFESIREYITV